MQIIQYPVEDLIKGAVSSIYPVVLGIVVDIEMAVNLEDAEPARSLRLREDPLGVPVPAMTRYTRGCANS